MERGAFIFAVGFTVMVGLYALNMTRIDGGGSNNSAVFADTRQARQISLSGLQVAINKLRINRNFPGLVDSTFLGGKLTVTIVDIGNDQRKVFSTGTFGTSPSHRTVSIVQLPQTSTLFDMNLLHHQTAMQSQGRSFATTQGIAFLVDGRDTASGSSDNKYGIGASPRLTSTAVSNALTAAGAGDKVIGLEIEPSVTTLTDTVDMVAQKQAIKRVATIIHRSGTLGRNRYWGDTTWSGAPEVVFVTKSLTVDKKLIGKGVLFIDGDLTVKNSGQIVWWGYVIVHGNILKVQGGSMRVDGTLYFGKRGEDLRFGSSTWLHVMYHTTLLDQLDAQLSALFGAAGKPSLVTVFD